MYNRFTNFPNHLTRVHACTGWYLLPVHGQSERPFGGGQGSLQARRQGAVDVDSQSEWTLRGDQASLQDWGQGAAAADGQCEWAFHVLAGISVWAGSVFKGLHNTT